MDAIEGIWCGSKSIPFLASGSGEVTVNEDGTACAIINAKVLGKDHHLTVSDIHWTKEDDGSYTGSYKGKIAPFHLNGDKIIGIFNPYRAGVTTITILNINIPFELTRK